jgi:hypothetical protein
VRAPRIIVLVALMTAAACSDINNHLLEGQQYYAPGECLGPSEVIDDLSGSDPGDNCTPECLQVPQQNGQPVYYITTTCPPYTGYAPPELPDAAKDAADPCVGAFAAFYGDGGLCTSFEGGIEAGVDAADGGAHTDATVDGGAEAAADAGDANTGG